MSFLSYISIIEFLLSILILSLTIYLKKKMAPKYLKKQTAYLDKSGKKRMKLLKILEECFLFRFQYTKNISMRECRSCLFMSYFQRTINKLNKGISTFMINFIIVLMNHSFCLSVFETFYYSGSFEYKKDESSLAINITKIWQFSRSSSKRSIHWKSPH